MIKWYHKAVFYLRTLSIAKIYGVSEYGALVLCDWTALYNAALLRCSSDAPRSPLVRTVDQGFTPRTALSGKGMHWMETNNVVSCCYTSESSQTWSLVSNIWKTFCKPAPIRPAAPHGRLLGRTLMTLKCTLTSRQSLFGQAVKYSD
jgi:hypothetical protein